MQIHDLPAASPASGMVIAADTGTVNYKIDYDALADAILDKLTTKTYTTTDGTETLIAAINALETTKNSLGAAATKAVANNLTTTASGYVLDARQGKTLNDSVTTLNSNLNDTESGSISFTIGDNANAGTITYHKKANAVTLYVNAGSGVSFGSGMNGTLGTLPSGFRPPTNLLFPIHARTSGSWASATYYSAYLNITTSGTITLRCNESNIANCQYLSGGATFITV